MINPFNPNETNADGFEKYLNEEYKASYYEILPLGKIKDDVRGAKSFLEVVNPYYFSGVDTWSEACHIIEIYKTLKKNSKTFYRINSD